MKKNIHPYVLAEKIMTTDFKQFKCDFCKRHSHLIFKIEAKKGHVGVVMCNMCASSMINQMLGHTYLNISFVKQNNKWGS